MEAAMVFRKEDILRFRAFIKGRWGISIPEGKDYLVEAKLRKAMDATGCNKPEDLFTPHGEQHLQRIAESVTTNHTFFFRESDHFDILVREARQRRQRRLLIWSAAAASGEECYSLAIRLLEEGWSDFRILASDIDHRMLTTINEGYYPEVRLKNVSLELREKYFGKQEMRKGTAWFKVCDELRDRIVIKALNLLEDHRFAEPFDYVLCRNVLIYFDHPTQGKVIDRLSQNLKPGGLLFLGHSESIMTIPHHHPYVQVASSVYRSLSSEGGADVAE